MYSSPRNTSRRTGFRSFFGTLGEQIVQVADQMTGEQRTEYRYHAAKITHSVPWPISESDLAAVLEAARPELEQRAQNAEALEEEFS
jgi:hypothetical protein